MEIWNSCVFQVEYASCEKLKNKDRKLRNQYCMVVWNTNMTDWKGFGTRRGKKVTSAYVYFYD